MRPVTDQLSNATTADVLGMSKADRTVLRDLKQREFFGFGPAFSVAGVFRMTTDTVATTMPKAGHRFEVTVPPPSSKVKSLLAEEFANLPQEAETEIRELADAKREISARDAEIRRLKSAAPQPTEAKLAAVKAAVARDARAEWEPLLRERDVRIRELERRLSSIGKLYAQSFAINEKIADELLIGDAKPLELKTPTAEKANTGNARSVGRTDRIQSVTTAPERTPTAVASEAAYRPAASPSGDDIKLKKAERKICETLAAYPEGLKIGPLAMLSGYRVSGGFRNSLSALRSVSYVDGENTGVMRLTEDGFAYVGGPREMPTGDDLVRYWSNHSSLKKCERSIINELLRHPHGLPIDELARATNYEVSGGFRNALSALRSAQILVGGNTGTMRLTEAFFQ